MCGITGHTFLVNECCTMYQNCPPETISLLRREKGSPLNVYLHLAISTPLSFGALTSFEKMFNCGHPITVNFSKEGNIILQFPEWKFVRPCKQRSSKDFNWLKVISSPSLPSFFATTSVILLHSNITIFFSCNRLLTVEGVNKLINCWHFDTFNFFKFSKDVDDGTKVSNLSHSDTTSFWSLINGWELSFQICLSLGILRSFNFAKCSNVAECCSSSLKHGHISSKGAPFNSRNFSPPKNSIGNPPYVLFRVASHFNVNSSKFGNVCWKTWSIKQKKV